MMTSSMHCLRSCAACSARVEKAVSKVPGVTSCSVSLLTNSMGVEGTATAEAVIQAVVDAVAETGAKLLVMDEVLDAVAMEMLSDEALAEFLKNRPEDLEVVMTGRAPTPCVEPLCDYITRMTKIRHPYDQGLNARIGVEF